MLNIGRENMEESSSYKRNHGSSEAFNETPDQTRLRLMRSSGLRFLSSAVQIAAGATTGNFPLLIEGAEELSDGVAYAAGAKEVVDERFKGLARRAQGRMVGAAIVAASVSTVGVIDDIASNRSSYLKPMEGLDFAHNDIRAAALAVSLSSIVFYLNRHTKKSTSPRDKYIYIDSVRDFAIPSIILGLSALSSAHWFTVPQYSEYIFESFSTYVGWWNANRLRSIWFKTRKTNTKN
jgi:hypothetical protein